MRRRIVLAMALLPLLAACGGTTASQPGVKSASTKPVPATKPVPRPVPSWRAPKMVDMPGLEGVIGADAASLTRQFGKARLDVWEGDARKLQFSGTACVLDIYLYPPKPKAEPQAAYVDARRASDGQDVDRAACVGALRR